MDEDDWKRRAIANDMLAFSSQGQKPSDFVREAYEEDGTRLVERYGKKKVWRYQYSPIWRRRPDLRAEIKRRFPGLLPR